MLQRFPKVFFGEAQRMFAMEAFLLMLVCLQFVCFMKYNHICNRPGVSDGDSSQSPPKGMKIRKKASFGLVSYSAGFVDFGEVTVSCHF